MRLALSLLSFSCSCALLLTPLTRSLAVNDSLHHLVLAILREPQNTKQGDPQLRFWVRQRFTLLSAPEGDFVLHEDKKVVLRSDLFDTVSAAHVAVEHGGRDKTYTELRKHSSYVPKEVVVLFIRLCPTCGGKRKTVKGKRPQGDKRIPLPKEILNGPSDDPVPDGTGILPRLLPKPEPALPAVHATTTADFQLDPALFVATSSSPSSSSVAHAPVAGPSNPAYLPALLPRPALPPSLSAPPAESTPERKRKRAFPPAPPHQVKPKSAARPRAFKHAQPGAHPAPAFGPQRTADDLASPAGAAELGGGGGDEGPRRGAGRKSARRAAAGISALAALEHGGEEEEDEYGARKRARAEEDDDEGEALLDEDAPGESDSGGEDDEGDDDEEQLVIDPDLLEGGDIPTDNAYA